MSYEGSVAPKERVNIVYRTAPAHGEEEVELPLKLLVLGDFTARSSETPVEKREPVQVDKDTLNEVLKAQQVSLELAVPNRIADTPDGELQLRLRFQSMKDFGPDALVRQVPELRRLLELREALRALKGPVSNVPEFRKKIHELLAEADSRQRLLAEIGYQQGGGTEP